MKGYKQVLRVDLGGEKVVIKLTAMRRKTLKLIITDTADIDLRIPLNCPQEQVQRFLARHEGWIIQRRTDVLAARQRQQNVAGYLGQQLEIGQWPKRCVGLIGQQLMVPGHLEPDEQIAALERWFRGQARARFEADIERWWPCFAHLGTRPVLRVKTMKTRWGSLSKRGYINLNRFLIHLDPELIELVVVHELCHLQHFDHGPGFQALMTRMLPDWRLRDRRLRDVRISGFAPGC